LLREVFNVGVMLETIDARNIVDVYWNGLIEEFC